MAAVLLRVWYLCRGFTLVFVGGGNASVVVGVKEGAFVVVDGWLVIVLLLFLFAYLFAAGVDNDFTHSSLAAVCPVGIISFVSLSLAVVALWGVVGGGCGWVD